MPKLFPVHLLECHLKYLAKEAEKHSKTHPQSDLFLGKKIAYDSVLVILKLLQNGDIDKDFLSQ